MAGEKGKYLLNLWGKILISMGIISAMFGYYFGFYDPILWPDEGFRFIYNLFLAPFEGNSGGAAAFNMAMSCMFLISGISVLLIDHAIKANK